MEGIGFKIENRVLTISVPLEIAKSAAENMDTEALIVNDIDLFGEALLDKLNGHMYDKETGLTEFQQLLDRAFVEVAMEGNDNVASFKYENH